MERVPNIPGSIPSLALYPPESLRSHLPPEEWQSCLDTWLICIEFRLQLNNDHFSNFKFSQSASGVPFLLSYLIQFEQRALPIQSGSKEAKLHHQCYFLLKRLLLTTKTPCDCTTTTLFDILGYGSIAFQAIPDWKSTLKQFWSRNEAQVQVTIESCKSAIIKASPSDSVVLSYSLRHLSSLVKCLQEVAVVVVAGADYLEAIASAYYSYTAEVQKAATECLYLCLRSLLMASNKHTSLLLDTLFDLKSETDRIHKIRPDSPTLFSNLVCSTPFLRHLKSDAAIVGSKRGQGLVEMLSEYQQHTAHLHPPPSRPQRKRKGKEKLNTTEGMHIHKASQISQVHDLFPDLLPGYVLRLLDHYSDNVETVIAALLEPESLPLDLRDQHDVHDENFPSMDQPPDLAPRSTPPLPSQRRNVFDGDELDRLQISSSKLHRGRKDVVDQPLSLNEQSRSKAAILSALAAFDADDDERDDTYDVADVGGAVDNTLDSDERRNEQASDKNEETLFKAWKQNPEMFGRDSKTRMSTTRRQFNDEVQMTNEQIEGWAIMISKDPKMVDRLQQKYSLDRSFQGTQRVIQSTKWQANASPSDSQDEGSGTQSDGRRVGQAGIRGPRVWNRGGGRGGGNTAGPTNSEATQLARKRKEQGRGRGGAHNRRDGRAKKIGRGMAGSAA